MIENRAVSDNEVKASDDCRLQFLSIGHFTHDIVGDDLILGGAAAYSSSTAKKTGTSCWCCDCSRLGLPPL